MSRLSKINRLALLLVPAACTVNGGDQALPDPLAAGWQGEPVCEQLHLDAQKRVLRCSFPPGVGHELHYHEPHFGYAITGGKMRITSNGESRVVDLPDGYSWTNDSRITHEVLNIGDTTSVYLIIESDPER